MSIKFHLGSDPELMLTDIRTGALRSAIDIIPEGKGAGRELRDGAVLHDNVLAEFNTRPAKTQDEFVSIARSVLSEISGIVEEYGCSLTIKASAVYPDSELKHFEAQVFGCDPDFDAWYPLNKKLQPDPFELGGLRSAGGHLHVGVGEIENINTLLRSETGKLAVVCGLDVFCGIISVFLDTDPGAAKRRDLYGKAGSHRPKEYGVEYRAMSSWWLASPEYTKLVYQLTQTTLEVLTDEGVGYLKPCEIVFSNTLQGIISEIGGSAEVQRIINNSDISAAKKVYEEILKQYLSEETVALIETKASCASEFKAAWGL